MVDKLRDKIASKLPKLCSDNKPSCKYYEYSKCEKYDEVGCRYQKEIAQVILNLFKSQVEGLTELTDEEAEAILEAGFNLMTKPTSQEHIQRIIQLQDCQRQLGGME